MGLRWCYGRTLAEMDKSDLERNRIHVCLIVLVLLVRELSVKPSHPHLLRQPNLSLSLSLSYNNATTATFQS